MIALEIHDTKSFMNQLLLQPVFDQFCLIEASITTFQTVHIDGRLQKKFYSADELEENNLTDLEFCYWEKVKPFCFSLIKGTATPLFMKITLSLSPANIKALLKQLSLHFTEQDIKGLLLNIKYDRNKITCITGTSLNLFIADKSIEYEWDSMVQRFFKQFSITSTLL